VAILINIAGNLHALGGNFFMSFAQQPVLSTKPIPMEKRVWYDRFPVVGEVHFPVVKEAM
jgi:hypothetical protein